MVQIKKLSKDDHTWAVFKDGHHVNAIIKPVGGGDWIIWLNDNRFTQEERQVIAGRLDELNEIKARE